MRKEFEELWKTVLGEIEVEVSRANFLTLFKNTSLLSIEENIATVASPSAISIDLLKKRFCPLIKKSLDKQTGRNIRVVFVAKSIERAGNITQKDGPLFSNITIQVKKTLARVRPDFTFQSMAVSSSNQLAFVSAQTVAKNLGRSYNPLFIYGPVGVGKTHLMQAIANEVFEKNADKKIVYATSEEFTNEVVEAIRTNDTARMKRRFRTVDLLLIDDVQFIAGKDRVQEELFHTFNILIDNASQVVLSSDRPPNEIKKLEKRLSSRFAAGLTVDIEPPDFELRTAILLIKAKKIGVDLPIEAAKALAEKVQDVRSLEGALLRVVTQATISREEITLDLVLKILGVGIHGGENHFHSEDVVNCVCSYYNIKPTLIKGPKRDASLVKARQITMFLLKKELGLTYVEIGNVLGGRDHTTIIHGVGKIEKLLSLKSHISSDILGITRILSQH